MAAPFSVTAPSSVQNLMNSSSRRSMVSRGVLMIETKLCIGGRGGGCQHSHVQICSIILCKIPINKQTPYNSFDLSKKIMTTTVLYI